MKTKYRNPKSVLVILGLCSAFMSHGQQQVQFTQYMYNTMLVNPAYAGTSNRLEAYFIHRSQWVGISGAPSSQNLGVHGAVTNKLGLGLNVTNDKIGPANQTYVNATGAVRLPLSRHLKLSIGLTGGIDVLNVDWSKGLYKNDGDQTMINNINNRIRPIVGAGGYLYGDNWYFGLSSPNFIRKDQFGRESEAMIHSNVHWYAIGGYVFQLSDNLKLKPAVLAKMVTGAPLTCDVSANFLIQDTYTLGVAYRYHDAMSFLAGLTFKKSFFLGYSYDLTLTKLRNYNSGSHDIMFKYTLFDKNQSARSPRFF